MLETRKEYLWSQVWHHLETVFCPLQVPGPSSPKVFIWVCKVSLPYHSAISLSQASYLDVRHIQETTSQQHLNCFFVKIRYCSQNLSHKITSITNKSGFPNLWAWRKDRDKYLLSRLFPNCITKSNFSLYPRT